MSYNYRCHVNFISFSKTNPSFNTFNISYSSFDPCLVFDGDRYGLTTVVLIVFAVEKNII